MDFSLDIRTIILLMCVVSTALTAGMAYLYFFQKTYPGFALWVIGLTCSSIGTFLFCLRGIAPDFLSIIVANLLFACIFCFMVWGLEAFTGQALPRGPDYLVLSFYTISYFYFTYLHPNIDVRVIVGCLVFSYFCLKGCWLIRRRKNALRLGLFYVTLVALAIWNLIRAAIILLDPQSMTDFMAAGHFQAFSLVVYLGFYVLFVFGLVLANHHRTGSELLEKIQELIRSQSRIEEANRELDAFAQSVSHDLRTPLISITGFAELLMEQHAERLDNQARGFLQTICESGHCMATLVNDLLSLATVGKVESPLRTLESGEVAQRITTQLAEECRQKQVRIELGPLPPLRVHASHLEQLFGNLLNNAVKYAGDSSDQIEIWGESKGPMTTFFVRDHGPGLPREEYDKIFGLYYRASATPSKLGTGIGLATIRKIADFYQGRAWVEETPDGGCTFCVELHSPA